MQKNGCFVVNGLNREHHFKAIIHCGAHIHEQLELFAISIDGQGYFTQPCNVSKIKDWKSAHHKSRVVQFDD